MADEYGHSLGMFVLLKGSKSVHLSHFNLKERRTQDWVVFGLVVFTGPRPSLPKLSSFGGLRSVLLQKHSLGSCD